MKGKSLCIGLLCALLLGCLPLMGTAAPLSPALAVLSNDLGMSKCGLVGNEVTFYPEDFDAVTDSKTDSITVLTLPACEIGTLYLYDSPVETFTEIPRNEIENLTFRTACDQEMSCSFTFRQQTENEKYQAQCTLYMLDRLNFAPCMDMSDENGLSVGCSTYAGTLTSGHLNATDPEADSVFYRIVSYPQKGTVTLKGNEYRYFAFENAEGDDSFDVVAIDRYGNRSNQVTIPVSILSRKNNLNYTDMEDHDAHGAALTLSYIGAMSGTVIGKETVFLPDQTITRAEFVAALVCALGYETNINSTAVFMDSDSVPSHLMPSLACAASLGWIEEDAAVSFRPNDPINRTEAANLLRAGLEMEVSTIPGVDSATQSLIMMAQMGILSFDNSALSPDKALTRGEAAVAICKVLDRL